ncbi:hypothetical protein OO013_16405 [Mangrovivirga sp. M17]|uniref:PH (Pleckstrin Homology) domain-containing protein n=1 Tax=Mangrovivirga halotolerans TaxID=2993936 RepID=A0ABT3RUK3_9BACT|nr:hypothetical protein [Mangrovivirga halotolerans]MCX2745463.1 hypothetical protein [Mangrovivirga halotolerans]
MKKVLFQEIKRPYTDILILIVFLILCNTFFLYQYFTSIIILIPLDIGLLFILVTMRLKIIIFENSIKYKFTPYHFYWRELKLEGCYDYEIKEYNAIQDYKGVGRRFLTYKNEKAYLTDYNGFALQLKDKYGFTFTFGIRNHHQLQQILPKLKNSPNPI